MSFAPSPQTYATIPLSPLGAKGHTGMTSHSRSTSLLRRGEIMNQLGDPRHGIRGEITESARLRQVPTTFLDQTLDVDDDDDDFLADKPPEEAIKLSNSIRESLREHSAPEEPSFTSHDHDANFTGLTDVDDITKITAEAFSTGTSTSTAGTSLSNDNLKALRSQDASWALPRYDVNINDEPRTVGSQLGDRSATSNAQPGNVQNIIQPRLPSQTIPLHTTRSDPVHEEPPSQPRPLHTTRSDPIHKESPSQPRPLNSAQPSDPLHKESPSQPRPLNSAQPFDPLHKESPSQPRPLNAAQPSDPIHKESPSQPRPLNSAQPLDPLHEDSHLSNPPASEFHAPVSVNPVSSVDAPQYGFIRDSAPPGLSGPQPILPSVPQVDPFDPATYTSFLENRPGYPDPRYSEFRKRQRTVDEVDSSSAASTSRAPTDDYNGADDFNAPESPDSPPVPLQSGGIFPDQSVEIVESNLGLPQESDDMDIVPDHGQHEESRSDDDRYSQTSSEGPGSQFADNEDFREWTGSRSATSHSDVQPYDFSRTTWSSLGESDISVAPVSSTANTQPAFSSSQEHDPSIISHNAESSSASFNPVASHDLTLSDDSHDDSYAFNAFRQPPTQKSGAKFINPRGLSAPASETRVPPGPPPTIVVEGPSNASTLPPSPGNPSPSQDSPSHRAPPGIKASLSDDEDEEGDFPKLSEESFDFIQQNPHILSQLRDVSGNHATSHDLFSAILDSQSSASAHPFNGVSMPFQETPVPAQEPAPMPTFDYHAQFAQAAPETSTPDIGLQSPVRKSSLHFSPTTPHESSPPNNSSLHRAERPFFNIQPGRSQDLSDPVSATAPFPAGSREERDRSLNSYQGILVNSPRRDPAPLDSVTSSPKVKRPRQDDASIPDALLRPSFDSELDSLAKDVANRPPAAKAQADAAHTSPARASTPGDSAAASPLSSSGHHRRSSSWVDRVRNSVSQILDWNSQREPPAADVPPHPKSTPSHLKRTSVTHGRQLSDDVRRPLGSARDSFSMRSAPFSLPRPSAGPVPSATFSAPPAEPAPSAPSYARQSSAGSAPSVHTNDLARHRTRPSHGPHLSTGSSVPSPSPARSSPHEIGSQDFPPVPSPLDGTHSRRLSSASEITTAGDVFVEEYRNQDGTRTLYVSGEPERSAYGAQQLQIALPESRLTDGFILRGAFVFDRDTVANMISLLRHDPISGSTIAAPAHGSEANRNSAEIHQGAPHDAPSSTPEQTQSSDESDESSVEIVSFDNETDDDALETEKGSGAKDSGTHDFPVEEPEQPQQVLKTEHPRGRPCMCGIEFNAGDWVVLGKIVTRVLSLLERKIQEGDMNHDNVVASVVFEYLRVINLVTCPECGEWTYEALQQKVNDIIAGVVKVTDTHIIIF